MEEMRMASQGGTCSQASYDSDATVAPEEEEAVETELERQSSLGGEENKTEEDSYVECDNSTALSPSILHPKNGGPGRSKIM